MSNLIKIRDISLNYGISARTLRYYEDAGLISSIRSDDYAYRMYDESAVKRLEQILILRKLNISIKDIQRIFNAQGSEIVLDVLGKKVGDIDEEVALLQELKEIILGFIRQIENADFNSGSDVKLLYEKARDIENRISNNKAGEAVNKTLNILPKYQYNTGVIIPIDLGTTTLANYNRFTYRIKSSADVYGKGMSAYVSASADDLGGWLVGNASGLALFTNNLLVPSGPSGTNWLEGDVSLNLTDSQKALTGQIYILIGINDMWGGDSAAGIDYQIDDICLWLADASGQDPKNILIDFEGYATGPAPAEFIGRGGNLPPSLTINDESMPNVNRLFELSERLKKTPEVRVVRLPKGRMATSGKPSFFPEISNFMNWWGEYDKKRHAVHYAPTDFLFGKDGGLVWWMMVEDDATSEDCGGFDIIDFKGGLFAVHTGIDEDFESHYLVHEKIKKWIANTGFELDASYPDNFYMGHMIDEYEDEEINKGLGYHQYEIFIPIKPRA